MRKRTQWTRPGVWARRYAKDRSTTDQTSSPPSSPSTLGGRKKYGNTITTNGGYSFDSKLESATYDMLMLKEQNGEIRDVRVKPNVHLTDARILMIPDFVVWDLSLGRDVYIEAKGLETDVWRIKRRLWKHYGPGPLRVYKGNYRAPFLAETVTPV